VNRKRVYLVLLSIAVAVGAATWFGARQSGPSWRLPDGSQLSLAAVTYGRNHRVRYDNRWQDFLYPFLPAKWQARFGSRVASMTPAGTNAIVIWLWRRAGTLTGTSIPLPGCELVAIDENGLESERISGPSCSYTLPSGDTLFGWEVRQYPRRSRRFGIRIYYYPSPSGGSPALADEIRIRNRNRACAPAWPAEKLPATKGTNGLEVSLLNLKTGATTADVGLSPAANGARAFTRAEFVMREDDRATEDWSVEKITASAASGETRLPQGNVTAWRHGKNVFGFSGALWPEEHAWRLKVEVCRTAHFPASELWTISDVSVPGAKQINRVHAPTNIYSEEIEFLGLSAPNAKLPEDWTEVGGAANLHARTPYPLLGTRLALVEVRDDQGRVLEIGNFARNDNTASRGATLRQTDYAFAVKLLPGTKAVTATFAFSKSRTIEFLARPDIAKAPTEP
jgi:hypothetical protein